MCQSHYTQIRPSSIVTPQSNKYSLVKVASHGTKTDTLALANQLG